MSNIQLKETQIIVAGEVLDLDKKTVEQYITNGQPVTESEYKMFFHLCKANEVNPFLKEAYLVKYGTAPATILVDYKVIQKMAVQHAQYNGIKSGVVIINKNGVMEYRNGALVLKGEELVGGWAECFRKDNAVSNIKVASFEEFANKTKDGKLNSQWATKGAFMIEKVAKVHAFRETFPDLMPMNVYSQEELTKEQLEPKYVKANVIEIVEETNITQAQAKELANLCNGDLKLLKSISVELGYNKVTDAPKEMFDTFVDSISEKMFANQPEEELLF